MKKVLAPAAACALLMTIAACGDSDEVGDVGEKETVAGETAAAPTTTAPPTTDAEDEISEDCELAVRNWATAARKQQADLVFGAPDNASDPAVSEHANEISTYCPSELSLKVADVNLDLAMGEAKLVAGLEPGVDAAKVLADITAITDSLL